MLAPVFSRTTRVQTAFRASTSCKRACGNSPAGRRQCAPVPCPLRSGAHNSRQRPSVRLFAASDGFSTLSTEDKERRIDSLTRALKSLEKERDDAIATGESCAKTSVRLTDMCQLLEKLAMEKVTAGDDDAAKAVLREKASVKEMLDKANLRAQSNFALAAKIAEVIGQRQKEILDLAQSALPSTPSSSQPSTPSSSYSYTSTGGPSAPFSTSSSSSSYGSSSSSAYGSASYTPRMPRWEQSLLEARERLQQQEREAQARGRAARMTAEDSIAAARERIRAQGETINDAQQRLRRNAEESIAEAQARLRQQEVEAMMYLQRLTERYRRGEYVPEDELDQAFRQLKRL